MNKQILIFLLLLTLLPQCANAETVIYQISGEATSSSLAAIAPGTPFSGTFSFDTTTVGSQHQQAGSLPVTEYPQPHPPAHMIVNAAGLTIESIGDGLVQTSQIDDRVKFIEHFPANSFTGPGWSFAATPGSRGVMTSFILLYDGVEPGDLSQLPLLQVPARLEVYLGAGTYTFPDGSLTVSDDPFEARLVFDVTSLTLVPEPAAALLAVAGWAAVSLSGLKSRRKNRAGRP